jgi:hypothetical protein
MSSEFIDANDRLLRLLARFAAFLLRPIAHFHPSQLNQPLLDDPKFTAILRADPFAGRFERTIARQLGLDRLDLPDNAFSRLRDDREMQVALLVTSAGPEDLRLAANMVSGAILRKRLSALLARSDRENAIEQIGKLAFQIGIREAAGLYGDLEGLAPVDPPSLEPVGELADSRFAQPMSEIGYAWLLAFVRVAEPMLGQLLSRRLPAGFHPAAEPDRLDRKHRSQIATLLERRMPGWSQCIA